MMPSMSQIDMVVWRDQIKELQVCGSLAAGDPPVAGNVASPEVAEFLIVVRQDGNVAKLHETRTFGEWEFKVALGPQGHFETGKAAVATAVIILKHEPGGLETISWVQPVVILPDRPAGGEGDLAHFHTEAVEPPTQGELTADLMHSISSSLTIEQTSADGNTYRWHQKVERVRLV
jgi:hypothetical protein